MTVPAVLADALRDRYVLDRELGRGGMATVYLAHDLRQMPYYLSPAWLRIDPTWARLKDNARFKRLVAGGAV